MMDRAYSHREWFPHATSIKYNHMKEVKASLTGGTPEQDRVRAELPERVGA